MPSVSKKQHNLMAAVAHNPKFAKKVGIPQSVGKEFNKADKGKQFKRGGEMAESKKMKMTAKMFEKSGKDVEKKGMKEGSKADMALDKKQMMGMKKGGMAKPGMGMFGVGARKATAPADKAATAMGARKSYDDAKQRMQSAMQSARQKKDSAMAARKPAAPTPAPETMAPAPAMKKGGKVCGMKAGGVKKELPTAKDLGSMNMKKGGRVKCMAGGGYVRAADGVTKKGKTKGKII